MFKNRSSILENSTHPPQGSFYNPIYTQAVSVTDATLIFASGQVAYDKQGNTVGKSDFRAQTVKTIENLKAVLDEIGATWDNVLKWTTYVVNLDPAVHRPIVAQVMQEMVQIETMPASTFLGVQSLAREDLLIEIEMIVALET